MCGRLTQLGTGRGLDGAFSCLVLLQVTLQGTGPILTQVFFVTDEEEEEFIEEEDQEEEDSTEGKEEGKKLIYLHSFIPSLIPQQPEVPTICKALC